MKKKSQNKKVEKVETKNSTLEILAMIIVALATALLFSRKIDLTTADLGRHLKNGQIFVETLKIPDTNLYSYTQPGFPFTNHHWGFGVIVYLIYSFVGYIGLSGVYTAISVLTVMLFYATAKEKFSDLCAFLATALLLVFITNRTEIRPEGMSFLFMGIYFLLLERYRENRLKNTIILLPLLTLIQVLWVSIHIFFVFGPFLVLAYVVHEQINSKNTRYVSDKTQYLLMTLTTTTVFSLLNPNHIFGLLEPLNIFKEYGYTIVENMSPMFLHNFSPKFIYIYFFAISTLPFLLFILTTNKKQIKQNFAPILLFLVFVILSWKMIRGFPMFGFFGIYFFALIIGNFQKIPNWSLFTISTAIILINLIPLISLKGRYNFGWGIHSENARSIEFFKQNKLRGPIFNNYDIGGHIIWGLYPKEKVFVDNRPEAYSANFLQNTYIKAQLEPKKWEEILQIYNFNAIFFQRRDLTNWGQDFLVRVIDDEEWVPVYVDLRTIIFVRNTVENREIIMDHKLPREMFTIN